MNDRVLVVDDEETLRMVISQVLEADGFEVQTAASAEEALAAFRDDPYPLVITDIVMGRMSGIDLLEKVKAIDENAVVVIMTSHASVDTAIRALRNGAYDYLVKPFEDIELISAVARRARETRKLLDQNQMLIEQLKITTSELQSVNAQLRETAARDGLTGLLNHRSFREILDRDLAAARRAGQPLSVVLLDVDHFKHYNDCHGHLQGDDCLRSVARAMEATAAGKGVSARYGGEEFVLVLPRADLEEAHSIAEDLRARIRSANIAGSESQPLGQLTVSAGVSVFPADGMTANALIERADERLYTAKHAGRDRVCSESESEKTGTEG